MMVEVNASERELVMREFEQIKFDVQDWAHLEKCAISSLSRKRAIGSASMSTMLRGISTW